MGEKALAKRAEEAESSLESVKRILKARAEGVKEGAQVIAVSAVTLGACAGSAVLRSKVNVQVFGFDSLAILGGAFFALAAMGIGGRRYKALLAGFGVGIGCDYLTLRIRGGDVAGFDDAGAVGGGFRAPGANAGYAGAGYQPGAYQPPREMPGGGNGWGAPQASPYGQNVVEQVYSPPPQARAA